jgi:hypothetical protein
MRFRAFALTSVAFILQPMAPRAAPPPQGFDSRLGQAIDTWSSDHHTVVSLEARQRLVLDAHSAIGETRQQHPNFADADIANVVPSALAAFLTQTQNNATAATLPQLVQERLTGYGQVLPGLSDYPTLSVSVTPAQPLDFVVSINGTAYTAGSSLFRVRAGLAQVHVTRGTHNPCDRSFMITVAGPNVVACRF